MKAYKNYSDKHRFTAGVPILYTNKDSTQKAILQLEGTSDLEKQVSLDVGVNALPISLALDPTNGLVVLAAVFSHEVAARLVVSED